MTTITKKPDRVVATHRKEPSTRGPTAWIIVLSMLVVGMGAWIVYDYTQDTALAPPAEMDQLIDDYIAAWNDHDGEAFMETTRAGYTFNSGGVTYDRDGQLANIEGILPQRDWHVELLDDPLVVGDGPWYHVSFPVEITENLFDATHGVNILTLIESDGGYLVTQHTFSGS